MFGWNIHIWDVMPAQIVQGRQISIAGQTIFLLASWAVKMSILTSYLRISLPESWFRRGIWAVMTLSTVILVLFIFMLWLQCMYVLCISRSCHGKKGPHKH